MCTFFHYSQNLYLYLFIVELHIQRHITEKSNSFPSVTRLKSVKNIDHCIKNKTIQPIKLIITKKMISNLCNGIYCYIFYFLLLLI